jgi:hypothetical protein
MLPPLKKSFFSLCVSFFPRSSRLIPLEKLLGWKSASLSTTWLWLRGRDASEDLIGNFLTISNIAGSNTLGFYWILDALP